MFTMGHARSTISLLCESSHWTPLLQLVSETQADQLPGVNHKYPESFNSAIHSPTEQWDGTIHSIHVWLYRRTNHLKRAAFIPMLSAKAHSHDDKPARQMLLSHFIPRHSCRLNCEQLLWSIQHATYVDCVGFKQLRHNALLFHQQVQLLLLWISFAHLTTNSRVHLHHNMSSI